MFSVWRKLHKLKERTKTMNKEMNSLEKKIGKARDHLKKVQGEMNEDHFNSSLIDTEKQLLIQIEKWEGINEQVLRQRSRAMWIQAEDQNSKFFHAHLKSRQSRNRISVIYDEQRNKLTDTIKIEHEFGGFFQSLLGTSARELPCIDIEIARDGPCLSKEQQQMLSARVTKEEIDEAVRELPDEKEPGIDGFPAEFFKTYWSVVREETRKAVTEFFMKGKMLKSINCTTVTLVPKVTRPKFVKEFRPIACCTTHYKIIVKIITSRLKLVVDSIVGPAQSAFIEGRNILDNVIIAHELVKGYNQKRVSPRCCIKVDIRKAYDSMEWPFLKMILMEFGLPMGFVNLIMECVTTVSYSLILNGGLTEKFQAKKGLRQGDPMSPYLFVLVMEYLNRSLKKLNQNPDFNHHPKCFKNNITHICFADDLILCYRADKISIQLMLGRLNHFSEVSGLKANMEKIALYIAGVSKEFTDKLLEEMQFIVGEIPFKYLGVPLSSRKLSTQQWMPLVEKITTRIKC